MNYRAFVFASLLAAAAYAAPLKLTVSTEWLQAHARERGVTVVEIGDRTSYESAHIPGARFVAVADIAVTRNGLPNELPDVDVLEKVLGTAGVPDRGRIVIYARDPIVAARGFFTIDYLGCAFDAVLLDGGFTKWSAENRPIEHGMAAPAPRTFAACPHPDVVVNIGAMRKLTGIARQYPRAVTIIDGRPAAQFDVGRIATAVSVPWDENLTGGMTPVFRDASDLRELYRSVGVDDGAAVVVYCRSGMQASVDYFVLRALGRDVYLYDGGWAEWSVAENVTIERTPPS